MIKWGEFLIKLIKSNNSINTNDKNNNLQKELLLNEISKSKKLLPTFTSKFIVGCGILLLFLLVFFVILPLIDGYESVENNSLQSGYEIYNLKGDILNTWLSWKIPEDTLFHVHLSESQYNTKGRIDAIYQVMMSEETIMLNNNEMHSGYADLNYYLGWSGA